MLHEYITLSIGLTLIIYSIVILAFPPKFGNQFYGVRTNFTLKDPTIWADGQKFFAVSILAIGFIFSILGCFKIPDKIPNIAMFLLLITLWGLSRFIVHKILSKKFSI